ncbi:hypothetical protein ACFLQU_05275 [Verrucomicrobiota bacterium]
MEQAEKQHDFYRSLYKQYATDLLKMTIYMRRVIANPKIEALLAEKYPETLEGLRAVVFDDAGRR